MPVRLRKLRSGKIRVSTPGGVKSKGSTVRNARRQKRLLNALDHGFVPTRKKRK